MERDTFKAKGHPLITSLHPTTLEITGEQEITPRGDCIVGVSSSKGCADISERVKKAIREGSEMYLLLEIPGASEVVRGIGHEGLSLKHPAEMVFRRSGYISPRTVFIHADRSSLDLEREFVQRLRDPEVEISVTLGSV